jgi:hypothetical protein
VVELVAFNLETGFTENEYLAEAKLQRCSVAALQRCSLDWRAVLPWNRLLYRYSVFLVLSTQLCSLEIFFKRMWLRQTRENSLQLQSFDSPALE